MRKIVVMIFVLFTISVIGYVTIFIAINDTEAQSLQYVLSLIKEEVGLELSEEEIIITICEPKYSRDYACFASFQLSIEYTNYLKEMIDQDTTWIPSQKNARKIIDTYIEPSLSSFKNLNEMVKCLTSNTTYVKQIIQKELFSR